MSPLGYWCMSIIGTYHKTHWSRYVSRQVLLHLLYEFFKYLDLFTSLIQITLANINSTQLRFMSQLFPIIMLHLKYFKINVKINCKISYFRHNHHLRVPNTGWSVGRRSLPETTIQHSAWTNIQPWPMTLYLWPVYTCRIPTSDLLSAKLDWKPGATPYDSSVTSGTSWASCKTTCKSLFYIFSTADKTHMQFGIWGVVSLNALGG